jgi:hypothetical protein
MDDTHETLIDATGDVNDVSDMNDGSNTDDEDAVYDPRSSNTTETDELPNDMNSAAILPTMPEKPDDIEAENDATIGPTNERKLYTTSRSPPRNGAQWQGMTANGEESHDRSRSHARPSKIRRRNWRPTGIPNGSLPGGIGMGVVFAGSPVEVWVLVVDGDLRRCWDPGGKSTVLPWTTHAVGRLLEFRRELARLRNSLKGVGVTQHFAQRG